MKKIFLMVAAFLPAALFAQVPVTFTLKSKVGNLNPPAQAFLTYQANGKNVIDSTKIKNGEFTFTGSIPGPVSAYVIIDALGVGSKKLQRGVDAYNLYLEKGDINVASADSIAKAVVTGSKLNDDSQKLKDLLKPVNDHAKALFAEAANASDAQKINPGFQNGVQQKYKIVQFEQENVLKKFITANPGSFVSLAALNTLNGPTADPYEIDRLFNSLSPEVRATEVGTSIKSGLGESKKTAIGSLAPDFTQTDTSGNPVKLSALRGKYVLIDFWASWCGPCRQENPNVVKAYNHYKVKNFTIIGVSLDRKDDKTSWLKAIHDDGLYWNQVSDLQYWNNQVATLYKISSIPQNYLLDPAGKIIAKNLRGVDLENKLAEIFKM